jgi:hypothetical protein
MIVNALVEGVLDEAAARRVLAYCGHELGTCFGKRGWTYIQERIRGFSDSARTVPVLILVDHMDTGFKCPPEVITRWIQDRHPHCLLRVVVPELESWFLADRKNLAEFLRVPFSTIPARAEELADPKQTLVNAARKSRSARIRDALVPRRNSTAQVGPLYTSELIRFIHARWDIVAARRDAGSLDRCVRRVQELC